MSTTEPASHRAGLTSPLAGWLEESADGLDSGSVAPSSVLAALANAELPRIGVPQNLGGAGGSLTDAVEAIAEVSERSLTAGFVLWSHRSYIELLLQSPNVGLRDDLLPKLLDGALAGATGLSNAMKHLEGLEELQLSARTDTDALIVTGKLPWVTNLLNEAFHVAVAVSRDDGPPFIASLSSDDAGLVRSADLELLGLRASNTASVTVSGTVIDDLRLIHPDATKSLPQVRPAFLGLQCGMSIGLARRSLLEARQASGAGRNVLHQPIADLSAQLEHQQRALFEGLRSNLFHANAAVLFRIRIALAEIVAGAVNLELQASGGRAYLSGPGRDFARRWREAAFIPVITPSIVQLKTALARHRPVQA